ATGRRNLRKLNRRAGRRAMADIRMGVIGCGGRMGRMLIAAIAAAEGCALAGGTATPGRAVVGADLGELAGVGRIGQAAGSAAGELFGVSDVVIEFTTPAATAAHAALAAERGVPIVIGTTGLTPVETEAVHAAARRVPIVWAANTSLGIN